MTIVNFQSQCEYLHLDRVAYNFTIVNASSIQFYNRECKS